MDDNNVFDSILIFRINIKMIDYIAIILFSFLHENKTITVFKYTYDNIIKLSLFYYLHI